MLGFHQRTQGGEERGDPTPALVPCLLCRAAAPGALGPGHLPQGLQGTSLLPHPLRHPLLALVDELLAAATPLCHPPLIAHGSFPPQHAAWTPGLVWKDSPHNVFSKILPSVPAAIPQGASSLACKMPGEHGSHGGVLPNVPPSCPMWINETPSTLRETEPTSSIPLP